MRPLNKPLTLRSGAVIKNRLVKSAMSEGLGDPRHDSTESLVRLYRTWAQGGIGLCVTGNVMVDRTALGEPGNVVFDDLTETELVANWAAAAGDNQTAAWAQLNHPGKQTPAFLTSKPVAPSPVPLGKGLEYAFNTPRELSHTEILEIIAAFARAAQIVKQAGFGGVQIHGAHGYLVSQFLSPHHNQRTDSWGGDPHRRLAFPLAVYNAIRAAVGPEFPIGIKLNSADFRKSGLTAEEAMAAAVALDGAGIDLIEVSGGTYESPVMMGRSLTPEQKKKEAYFLAFAEQLRGHIDGAALCVTGGFRSAQAMDAALRSGAIDLVGMARPMCVVPDAPNHLLSDPSYVCPSPRPSTGIKGLDKAFALDVTWFEQQLTRIGRGDAPNPKMGAWTSTFLTVRNAGVQAFKMRRARVK
jgi:2,4-dienoyl-CoA reductase-like NADH-dependent reductase (Old Yellow Enzyme family)